jgi:2-dehydro-3-deoxyphosphogluconate aldolase/(4S)-4-hydroxy-2-oxoglutarate aldolase
MSVMAGAKETVARIGELGVVLVVRAKGDESTMKGLQAMVDGGVKALEITFSVPNAPEVIRAVKARFGDSVVLGAGTVLTPEQARNAVEAGASFLVAPNTDPEVMAAAWKLDVPMMPGAFTPTEIVGAFKAGAAVVKIFPASVGGPDYLKAVRAPLPHIPLMPTGGVDDRTAPAFLEAGAFALGAGSNLFDAKKLAAGDFKGMTETAVRFVTVVNDTRKRLAATKK